jgi:hypothetical protein
VVTETTSSPFKGNGEPSWKHTELLEVGWVGLGISPEVAGGEVDEGNFGDGPGLVLWSKCDDDGIACVDPVLTDLKKSDACNTGDAGIGAELGAFEFPSAILKKSDACFKGAEDGVGIESFVTELKKSKACRGRMAGGEDDGSVFGFKELKNSDAWSGR